MAFGCEKRPMKRLVILFAVFAVLSSGAAYGNTFFKSIAGVWKQKAMHTVGVGSDPFVWKSEHTTRVTILRDGTLYSYSAGVIQGKKSVAKTWHRPNGTFRGESYLGGKKIDEGTGEWRIDKRNRLITSIRYGREGNVTSIIRRVNNGKFLATTKGGRTTSEAVITRVRK
jgi:hypothetical protein